MSHKLTKKQVSRLYELGAIQDPDKDWTVDELLRRMPRVLRDEHNRPYYFQVYLTTACHIAVAYRPDEEYGSYGYAYVGSEIDDVLKPVGLATTLFRTLIWIYTQQTYTFI